MIVVFGASGNTGKRIAEALLAAGKQVRAVSRNPQNLISLIEAGTEAAIGDVEDAAFVQEALQGMEAAYLLFPPNRAVVDWNAYLQLVADNYVAALAATKVPKVVLLSSQGAQIPNAGPISAYGNLERALQKIQGLHSLALRPGYFMENLFAMLGMIKNANMMGGGIEADVAMPMVATQDIAAVAAQRLITLGFTGHTVEYIAGAADYTMRQVAATLGEAIGKPELTYTTFAMPDAKAGMMRAGLSDTIASGYVALFEALNSGQYAEGFIRTPENTTPTTLAQFATHVLAPAYSDI